MNITMHKTPCHVLSLDIVDVTGVHVVDVAGRLFKHRLDKAGQLIGFHDVVSFFNALFAVDGGWSSLLECS